MMENNLNVSSAWDYDELAKYDVSGPRYTSYPTALQFHEEFSEKDYISLAKASNDRTRPLSLYLHLPFCDKLCYYCACNKVITNNKERTSEYLNFLIHEIKMQAALFDINRPVTQLHWGGGSPTYFSNEEMTRLMHNTARYFNLLEENQGDYSIEIDPRSVDEERIGLIKGLGFNRISLGVQDFNLQVQESINRIQSLEIVSGIVKHVRNYKFKSLNFDLIYGLPYQSPESFSETIEQVIALSPDRLSLFNYAHMPNRFKNQRLIKQETLPGPQEKLPILCNSAKALINAGYEHIGFDHFAKPQDELAIAQKNGTLHRNFQGYSTAREADLIGLGVSAISKINGAYSQNQKSIATYQEVIADNHLPIERGYILDQDDQIRQALIEDLTCNNCINIDELEKRFNIRFSEYFSQETSTLNELCKDGLLQYVDHKWLATPKGRVLIRNICMAFDRHLQHNQASSKLYSKTI